MAILPDASNPKRRAAIARLMIAKKERGLDEDDWRDLMERITGKRSLREVELAQIYTLIDMIGGGKGGGARSLTGRYAPKLRALWISCYWLGAINDRSDDALLKFVKRMTGVDHTAFLRDAKEATKVIEALRAMLERCGVDWSAHRANPRRAVVDALWSELRRRNAVGFFGPTDTEETARENYLLSVVKKHRGIAFVTDEDWDQLIRVLGEKLRREILRERHGETESGDAAA